MVDPTPPILLVEAWFQTGGPSNGANGGIAEIRSDSTLR